MRNSHMLSVTYSQIQTDYIVYAAKRKTNETRVKNSSAAPF